MDEALKRPASKLPAPSHDLFLFRTTFALQFGRACSGSECGGWRRTAVLRWGLLYCVHLGLGVTDGSTSKSCARITSSGVRFQIPLLEMSSFQLEKVDQRGEITHMGPFSFQPITLPSHAAWRCDLFEVFAALPLFRALLSALRASSGHPSQQRGRQRGGGWRANHMRKTL
ncbi:hypothetical protein BaRGS_00012615 [Batillaria attramentaria]|uniref:Uncharacterized protein n=1 Tax=Batillaria attramentaria TaxID=370345 RepID=A0ABD0LA13_9CAEN